MVSKVLVDQPLAIQTFFDSFSSVDIHDHYRQGSLALERNWVTRTWWHRTFSTLLAMICTDAYLAYKHEWKASDSFSGVQLMSFKAFLNRLTYSLIHNETLEPPVASSQITVTGQHTTVRVRKVRV